MEELEVTTDRVIKVWWLQAWRIAAVASAYHIITLLADNYSPFAAAYVKIFGLIFMIWWNLRVVKSALQKRYEDFRIALVPLHSTVPKEGGEQESPLGSSP